MKRPEQALQKAIVQVCRLALPREWYVKATPNKPRSKTVGGIEKGMGTIAGWPDLEVWGEGKVWLIEVKSDKGSVRPEQHAIHMGLDRLGHPNAVIRSLDDLYAAAQHWRWPWRAC